MKKTMTLLASAALMMLLTTSAVAQNIELKGRVSLDKPFEKVIGERQTNRHFTEERLSDEELATVLWCAYGYNRPDLKKRTAPSARNIQETDIYVFMESGVYLYDAEKELLKLVVRGDHRKEISKQEHFAVAPVSIVLVSNLERMTGFDPKSKDFYSAIDCGYVSQNIYLCCAAMDNMGTVACGGIDHEGLYNLLHLRNCKVQLAHPVGHVK